MEVYADSIFPAMGRCPICGKQKNSSLNKLYFDLLTLFSLPKQQARNNFIYEILKQRNYEREHFFDDSWNDNFFSDEPIFSIGLDDIKFSPKAIELPQKEIDPTKERDYEISQVYQGDIGDCFLLATLAKHPEFIKDSNCLKWNDDGSATVYLYEDKIDENNKYVAGERKCITVSKDELEKNSFTLYDNGKTQNINLNEKQDLTLKALEIGYMKLYNYDIEKILDGGSISRAIRMLFGNNNGPSDYLFRGMAGDYSREDLKNAIYGSIKSAALLDEKYRNTDNTTIKDAFGNDKNLLFYHAYTINYYDKYTDTVSISNPHGNRINDESDDIVLKYEDFHKLFSIQTIEDTPNANVGKAHMQKLSCTF